VGFDSKRLQVPDPGRDFSSCVPDVPPRHESAPTPCWPPAPLSVVLTAHAMQIAIILLFAGSAVKRNSWASSEGCPSKRRGGNRVAGSVERPIARAVEDSVDADPIGGKAPAGDRQMSRYYGIDQVSTGELGVRRRCERSVDYRRRYFPSPRNVSQFSDIAGGRSQQPRSGCDGAVASLLELHVRAKGSFSRWPPRRSAPRASTPDSPGLLSSQPLLRRHLS
jgi:hypothetical protein